MTVSNETARKQYTGDGTTSAFSTNPVIFYDTSTINVQVVTTATGGAVTLVENTDYTISGGAGAVGSVDMSAGSSPYGAPSALEYVVLIRDEPYLQADDFVNNSASDAEVIESRYDKVTMEIQQLLEQIARSIKFPDIETASVTLPNYVDRASQYLYFDALGDLAVSVGSVDTDISNYMYTLLDDTTAGEAQATLGLVIGTNVQAWDTDIDDIAALTPTDGNIIIGDGANWVAGSVGTDVQAWDAGLDDLAGLAAADGNIIVGDGANWIVESGATARTSLGLGTADDVSFAAITGSGVVTGDTGVFTNGATSNGNKVREVGRETIWLPAGSWTPNDTNGAAPGSHETATNKVMVTTLDFDMTTSESACFPVPLPKNYDGGVIRFRPYWIGLAGSGTVTWTVSGVALSDSDVLDTAFGTGISVTDTLTTIGDIQIGAESADVTIDGTPADADLIVLRIERTISDTLSGDGSLVGIHVYITTDAGNDD
jgi:hypothetical protein